MPGGSDKPPEVDEEAVKAMMAFIQGDNLYPAVKPYLRNAVLCNSCKTVAESGSRHAMHSCECGAVSADGGLDYLRRVWHEDASFTELSVKNPAYVEVSSEGSEEP